MITAKWKKIISYFSEAYFNTQHFKAINHIHFSDQLVFFYLSLSHLHFWRIKKYTFNSYFPEMEMILQSIDQFRFFIMHSFSFEKKRDNKTFAKLSYKKTVYSIVWHCQTGFLVDKTLLLSQYTPLSTVSQINIISAFNALIITDL